MKKNPYARTFRIPRPELSSDVRLGGSNERWVDNKGEINASSKVDALNRIDEFLKYVQSGKHVVTEEKATEAAELAKTHRKMVEMAFTDSEAHEQLGKTLASELYVSASKEGFARNLLKREEVQQGTFPVITLAMKNVLASVAVSPTRVETRIIRDNRYFPQEFYISTRLFVEYKDIYQYPNNILERKYLEGLEGTMVAEDKTWKLMANKTIGVSNHLTNIVGSTTPTTLANLRIQVSRWGIPVTTWLIADNIWSDIIGNTGFQSLLEPVSKHELVMTGKLATMLGMDIITDAYRHPQHKVLNEGEMYVIGDTEMHGAYTDRGGVESLPLDGAHENIPGRGWMLTETLSMIIANSRSVAMALRT